VQRDAGDSLHVTVGLQTERCQDFDTRWLVHFVMGIKIKRGNLEKTLLAQRGSDMCGFGAGRLPFSKRHAETMGGRLLPVRFMAWRRSCDEDVRQRIRR
jgi:hypothetical protein